MPTVWKIAPGDKAYLWSESLKQGCITINWMHQTDLAQFKTEEDLKKALKEAKQTDQRGAIWDFVKVVQRGDTVVANNGQSKVVGVGVVESDYLRPDHPTNPRKAAAEHPHVASRQMGDRQACGPSRECFRPTRYTHDTTAERRAVPQDQGGVFEGQPGTEGDARQAALGPSVATAARRGHEGAAGTVRADNRVRPARHGQDARGQARRPRRAYREGAARPRRPPPRTTSNNSSGPSGTPAVSTSWYSTRPTNTSSSSGASSRRWQASSCRSGRKPGPFLRLCRAAEKNDQPVVLVIDEINRGNLPKLLGEFVYALEYRGCQVTLPFDDGRTDLIVPRNLYVIATMNSADRSIGHIDVAIRRRFGLYPLRAQARSRATGLGQGRRRALRRAAGRPHGTSQPETRQRARSEPPRSNWGSGIPTSFRSRHHPEKPPGSKSG